MATREEKGKIVAWCHATSWTDLSRRDRYDELFYGILPITAIEELDEWYEELDDEEIAEAREDLGLK